jgi:hypothetical protein
MSTVVSECGSSRKASCTIRAPSVSVSRARPRPLVSSHVGTRRVASFDDVAGASTIDLDIPSSGPGPAARRVAILENCRLATGGGVVVTSDAPNPPFATCGPCERRHVVWTTVTLCTASCPTS